MAGGPTDPAYWVQPGRRLLLDTNILLHRQDRVFELFERTVDAIVLHRNPVVITAKVRQELHGHLKSPELEKAAAGALDALSAAVDTGTVEVLGDTRSNRYADDNFEDILQAFGASVEMCVVTDDINLLIRLNLLGRQAGTGSTSGTLTPKGKIEFENPRELYARGARKLKRPDLRANDRRELEELLPKYKAAFLNPFSYPAANQPTDGQIQVTSLPASGDAVEIEDACGSTRKAHLGALLGSGGEGSVYLMDDGLVAKIFKQSCVTRHRREKVSLLVARQFVHERIAFPCGIVRNSSGEFVGYVMPKINGMEFSRAITRPERFLRQFPGWKKSDLIAVCTSFLELVEYLHALNIVVGDMNPKNLLVDSAKHVSIIDADSWQFEGYPCPVGVPEYTPFNAEVGGLLTLHDERWAVAVTLFRILMTGCGVYDRRRAPMDDPRRLVKEARFAFQLGERSDNDQPLGPWKFMWSHLPRDHGNGVKDMFWHTFDKEGERYGNWPSIHEWVAALHRYKTWLVNDYDPQSAEVYPQRLRAITKDAVYECPRCGVSLAAFPIFSDQTIVDYKRPICSDCAAKLVPCTICGRRMKPNALDDGVCWNCQTTAFDPSHPCADCQLPFITFRHATKFRKLAKALPDSHKQLGRQCDRNTAGPAQHATHSAGARAPSDDAPDQNGRSTILGRIFKK